MNEGALELVPERRACFSCKAEKWQPTTMWTKMQSRRVREEVWMEPTNKPFLSHNLVLITWLHSILRHEKCWSQKKKKIRVLKFQNSASFPIFTRRESQGKHMKVVNWGEAGEQQGVGNSETMTNPLPPQTSQQSQQSDYDHRLLLTAKCQCF